GTDHQVPLRRAAADELGQRRLDSGHAAADLGGHDLEAGGVDTERGEEVACRAGRVRVAGAVLGAAGERRAGAVALVAAAVGHGLVAALLGAQPRVDGRVVVADGAGAVGVDLDGAPVAALHGPGPALVDRLALDAERGREVGDRARRVDGGRVVAERLG